MMFFRAFKVKCALKNHLYLKIVDASSNEGGGVWKLRLSAFKWRCLRHLRRPPAWVLNSCCFRISRLLTWILIFSRGAYQDYTPGTGVGKINVTWDFQVTFILPRPFKVKCALKNRLYLKRVNPSSTEGGSVWKLRLSAFKWRRLRHLRRPPAWVLNWFFFSNFHNHTRDETNEKSSNHWN